ncbi:hypothetical protein A4X06_0g2088 [Tilletia controversa]|uniref:ATPase AAA-type core domain-containing protein n=2 Tax=Tilletia TaxID=13289 RepID=A0A8X7MYA5_9BASI|nr:hypothetical protein CF335_g7093 [Tilletia laevis]KAE8252578.1 hypothetical protein A4X06_0g2088 [Tilletia controversa]
MIPKSDLKPKSNPRPKPKPKPDPKPESESESAGPTPTFSILTKPTACPAGVDPQLEELDYSLFKPIKRIGVFKHVPLAGGAILYGPPGTGKTFIVAHVASAARVPVVVLRANTVHSKFYGESEKCSGSNIADMVLRSLQQLAHHIEKRNKAERTAIKATKTPANKIPPKDICGEMHPMGEDSLLRAVIIGQRSFT